MAWKCVRLPVDLTAPDMLAQVAAATEGLEVGSLFYVAGAGGDPYPLIDQPVADALHTIHLNVVGQTPAGAPFRWGMAARGRGAIVLVGSLGCVAGSKRLAVYAASKAYTWILAEGLWAELNPLGVEVIGLLIGRTRTPALERSSFGQDTTMAVAEPGAVVDYGWRFFAEGLWAELEPLGVNVIGLLIGRTRTPALERSHFGQQSDMAVAEPAEVVDYALENLQNGPIVCRPNCSRVSRHCARCRAPRR